MSLCTECVSIVGGAIKAMPADLSCVAVAAAFGLACEAAIGETGIGTIVCAVGGAIVAGECEKHGWPWVQSHSSEVATQICKAAYICW